MKKGPIVALALLTLLPGVALAPTVAFANRVHGAGAGRSFVHGPVVSRSVVVRPFFPHRFVPRPFFPRPFFRSLVPFGLVAGPVIAYAPSLPYYAPPTYYD